MNSKIILPEEIVEEIIKFAYEPKRYSISEGGDNIIDFMKNLHENDEIEYVTNNQMGYVIYNCSVGAGCDAADARACDHLLELHKVLAAARAAAKCPSWAAM